MSADRLIIFDTTLRDGEQAPGFSMRIDEKLRMARQLAALGVDLIEAGFPIASEADAQSVRTIATHVQGPVIAALARCNRADIERAAWALEPAERRRIHVFIATSDLHLERKLRMSRAHCLKIAMEAVRFARTFTDDVQFSAEDATRSDPDFLWHVVEAVIQSGAKTINLPDTVGYSTPDEIQSFFSNLIRRVPSSDQVVWSAHCHDDLGLAVANTLAALTGGARQVECTVNGIGERAGNCSLEEIVMALKTRMASRGVTTGAVTQEISRTSRLVSRLTGYPVPPNKAIVGANAFAHEAGIHQHGVMMDRTTYEIMDPLDVGLEGSRIVLGKHSGRHAFVNALEELGFSLDKEEIAKAFARFKAMADRKIRITDIDLEAIVVDEMATEGSDYELVAIQVAGGTHLSPTATVRLQREGELIDESAIGDGMIDAACGAIQRATGVEARLESFTVSSVTGGIDALGDVTIVLATGGREGPVRRATGRGVSTDVVEASARAYLSAANRLVHLGSMRSTAEVV